MAPILVVDGLFTMMLAVGAQTHNPTDPLQMTDASSRRFAATGQISDPMFEILEATSDEVVAIRVEDCTVEGFRNLYDLLSTKTATYGKVHLYEETANWTLSSYVSNVHGVLPDLRQGSSFHIDRYAAVGDSNWAKLLYYQWRAVAPVWPVAPDEMRYFELSDRGRALDWVKTGTDSPEINGSGK